MVDTVHHPDVACPLPNRKDEAILRHGDRQLLSARNRPECPRRVIKLREPHQRSDRARMRIEPASPDIEESGSVRHEIHRSTITCPANVILPFPRGPIGDAHQGAARNGYDEDCGPPIADGRRTTERDPSVVGRELMGEEVSAWILRDDARLGLRSWSRGRWQQ